MDKFAFPIFMLLFAGVAFLILDSRAGYLKKLREKLNQSSKGQIWNKLITATRLISGLFAAGLFLVVVIMHVCTWISSDVARYTHSLMWLHLWVLIAFFICVGFAQQKRKPSDRKNYLRGMPKWTNVVMTVLGIYMLSLFALDAIHSHGGYSINERNGKHFIKLAGQAEHEMSAEEYLQHELHNLRTFSSFWIEFSFCAAAYLLLAKDETLSEASV
jgi:uncharacterized membrane protein (Fun14 family)